MKPDLEAALSRWIRPNHARRAIEARRVEDESPGARDLPGASVEGPEGSFHFRQDSIDINVMHGVHSFCDVLSMSREKIALLAQDRDLLEFDARTAVFLDTETTSLGGGAGVTVFLVGIAFFHADSLTFEQYFMRDFDDERAMLLALAQRLSEFDSLVTFFGKNFDCHRLRDRFRLHRIKDPLPSRHLDLCHVSRRLFKRRLKDVRLRTVEQEVLGIERKDDLSGAECPDAWFAWIRGESDGRVTRLFEHNRIDVLSLVTLVAKVESLCSSPDHGDTVVSLAYLFEKWGNTPRALELYAEALHRDDRSTAAIELYQKRGRLLRRLGRFDGAVEDMRAWARLEPERPEALIELAKILEHQRRDLKAAHLCARMALEIAKARARRLFGSTKDPLVTELEKRVSRLAKKEHRTSCP